MAYSGIRRLSAIALVALAACSQSATNSALPPTAPGSPARSVSIPVVVKVPRATRHHGIGPRYVSPATKSITIVVTPSGGRALPTVTLSCSAGVCKGNLEAPLGSDTFTVSAYDAAGGTGNLLSTGSVTQKIVKGKANVVHITLTGVPAIIYLHLSPSQYNYATSGTITITVSAVDADGYSIAGSYLNTVTVSDGDTSGHSSMTKTTIVSSTDSITLSYDSSFGGAYISATAPNVAKAALNLNVYLNDDWTMFAHDGQRTGMESLPTNITPSTVTNLETAWVTSPDNGACKTIANAQPTYAVESSPVVYGGLVYYTNVCGEVYALNRATGAPSSSWATNPVQVDLTGGDQTSGVYGTPTLDPANNLLLIPVWGNPGSNCPAGPNCTQAYGGYVLALNAQTGARVWKSTPRAAGNVRGSPLVMNGYVYVGVSGGDPDTGYAQGGMMQLSETTGAQVGFFQVAPPSASNDGGSSWSPVSTDGTYIYFGTGNTLNNDGHLDSVIQMNPTTMSPNNTYGTYGTSADEDVGGGELIYGGNIYFSGKSGKYYGFSLGSFPVPLFAPLLINTNAAPEGNGGIGTPTTDGNEISVSSGYNNSSPYVSDLDLFPPGSSTRTCKLTTGNSAIYSSAAWVKPSNGGSGIGFIGFDNQISPGTVPKFIAFDDSCNILWSGTGPPTHLGLYGFFYAGPAVVQSGVYAVDNVGNVYSWKLPATMNVDARGMRVRAVQVRPPIQFYLNHRKRWQPVHKVEILGR